MPKDIGNWQDKFEGKCEEFVSSLYPSLQYQVIFLSLLSIVILFSPFCKILKWFK